jgi:hypothetical protein
MRYLPIIVVLAGLFAAEYAAAQSAAQPVNTPPTVPAPTAAPPFTNSAISASLTCGELMPMLRATDKRPGGFAIIWLDGYYAARGRYHHGSGQLVSHAQPGHQRRLRDGCERLAYRA